MEAERAERTLQAPLQSGRTTTACVMRTTTDMVVVVVVSGHVVARPPAPRRHRATMTPRLARPTPTTTSPHT